MAIRKSKQEELVVSGNRDEWIQKCVKALESTGFTNVSPNLTLYQINADYKKFTTSGTIKITLTPSDDNTKISVESTANVDNIYALFKSPNNTILSKFKEGLR